VVRWHGISAGGLSLRAERIAARAALRMTHINVGLLETRTIDLIYSSSSRLSA
jgi:hypothetical protein